MSKNSIRKIQPIDFHWEMESPFLFCAHHKDHYPIGNAEQAVQPNALRGRNIGSDFIIKDGFRMYHGSSVPGFPVHPHRGFETVTIVRQGFVDHFDSKGSYGRYGAGDVQWMTAGAGCQHAEMFPLINQEEPNTAELFQVWLNLPKKDKMTPPEYKMLWAENIPQIEITGTNGKTTTIRLIAGKFQGTESLKPCPNSWANDEKHHVGIYLIDMEAGSTLTFPAGSETLIRNLYFYEGGSIVIDGTKIESSNRIKLSGDHAINIVNGGENSYMVLLEGEPIREPVVQYGPFVMNTEEEIRETFRDYQKTEFGGWHWDRTDPVNPIDSGRFAKYADGRIEKPKK
jgi:redox-sensitive bicupin YhaK (pirin superfamily)